MSHMSRPSPVIQPSSWRNRVHHTPDVVGKDSCRLAGEATCWSIRKRQFCIFRSTPFLGRLFCLIAQGISHSQSNRSTVIDVNSLKVKYKCIGVLI